MENPQDRQIYMDRLVVKIQTKFMNFYDNINLEWKERIINMKIDRFNVVELKDGNRATIIDVRGKNEYFAEVVNAYGQTVAKRNIIDEEIK